MNQSLPKLIDSMRRALREEVQPELSTDHARSQLAGVLDILAKVERMLAWSPDVLREQLGILRSGDEAVMALAVRHGVTAPATAAAVTTTDASMTQAELEQAVRAGEQRIAQLTDWLFDPATPVRGSVQAEVDATLRDTLRQLLVAERKLIPRADFGAMTAGAAKAA